MPPTELSSDSPPALLKRTFTPDEVDALVREVQALHADEQDRIPYEKVREMLTMEQLLSMIPFERVYLFRLEKEGMFPKAHFVTPKKRLWFKDEVIQWQRDLADPTSELSQAVQLKLQRAKGE